jgi:TatA/E family protein of Tat protein translocase
MFGLGLGEVLVILFIALIFIGPKKLPGLARGLGKGIREFQNAAKGITDSVSEPVREVKDQIQQTKDQINPLKDVIAEDGDVSPDHGTTQDKTENS